MLDRATRGRQLLEIEIARKGIGMKLAVLGSLTVLILSLWKRVTEDVEKAAGKA